MNAKKFFLSAGLIALTFVVFTIPAHAAFLDVAGTYAVNGHVYEVYAFDDSDPDKSWATANAIATSLSGHLATITSAGEDNFINALRVASGSANSGFTNSELWVGGFQPPGSTEPGGGWTWVNGEGAFTYTNWGGGEPNGGVSENHLAVGLNGFNQWNDEGNLDGIYGFVVEYDVPEPSTIAIWSLLGFVGLGGAAWRRRKRMTN